MTEELKSSFQIKVKMKYQISEFINFLKLKFLLVLIYQSSKEMRMVFTYC